MAAAAEVDPEAPSLRVFFWAGAAVALPLLRRRALGGIPKGTCEKKKRSDVRRRAGGAVKARKKACAGQQSTHGRSDQCERVAREEKQRIKTLTQE